MAKGPTDSRLELRTAGPFRAGSRGALRLAYRCARSLGARTRLWLFYDIRQLAGAPQADDASAANLVTARLNRGGAAPVSCYHARTLDLYPQVPEFLHVCQIELPSGMAADDELDIDLGAVGGGWEFPRHPIGDFHFWLVEGRAGQVFAPTGYKTHRSFDPPCASEALSVSAAFEGDYPGIGPANTRPTPGILWGDLHGMAFNQRPLDDYYAYAREVAGFDFAAAMLFSYNVCVGDVWGEVVRAANRFTRPGEFVAIPGVEFGTPTDGSHRNAHFFGNPERVPPIFFEERPPALDPRLTDRLHPDTIRCRDLEHFYAVVGEYGGVVSGHFHTLTYAREILAEMWQKQSGSAGEEERIFGLLNKGMRLGLVAGSDTHDSMPGNPEPEPGCPQPAGFTAVLADEITPSAIHQALVQRRVYGTTGARIALRVDASGHPMGSVVPVALPRCLRVQVEGAGPLARVELVRQGAVVDQVEPPEPLKPMGPTWEGELADRGQGQDPAWYLIRVTQRDGHRAWSSPIWFEREGDWVESEVE
jgi:uncharacterized protein DUF3604